MDNLDIKAPGQTRENDTQAQLDALRHLITSTLILVIVISGTFNIYLLRQWRTVSKELEVVRPQAEKMVKDFQQNTPLMDDFVSKITDYGRTHPDFAPILAKYNLRPAGAIGAAPAPPTSSPATKPKK
jgi:hypothetical protein